MSFDLENSIAAWRRAYEVNTAFSDEDVEELEGSLRDRIESLVNLGKTEKDAFGIAIKRIGSSSSSEKEYKKVYWGKLKRQHKLTDELKWRVSMLKNYIKVALRALQRQKGYSFLNISGLSVGLACAFLLVFWIQDELSYDRFHENGDQIYRVMRHARFSNQVYTANDIPLKVAHVLADEYPEVESTVLMTRPEYLLFKRGELMANENGRHAGPQFFEMFSWDLIRGEPSQVLKDPLSIVISASLAEKYFGSDWVERGDIIGKTIHVDNRQDFTVTGVFDDIPLNSSTRFDFVLPIEDYIRRSSGLDAWDNSSLRLFIQLREETNVAALGQKIIRIQDDHLDHSQFRSELFLQSYEDQHLYSNYENGVLSVSRVEYNIRIFGIVAFMVVLIACINFMNLSTARSVNRSKEIGVRKAIGAERRALIWQFMGESMLLVFAGVLLAMVLVLVALPAFNGLTEKSIDISDLRGSTLLLFAGIGTLTALIAGTYPALYLSSFSAVNILRGTFRLTGGSAQLRKGLVVFQFSMSILLIVGTVTIYQQIRYINSKHLGLDRENIVYTYMEEGIGKQFSTVKEELLQRPGIVSVTSASENPLEVRSNTHNFSWPGKDPDSEIPVHVISASLDFLEVMKMELVTGRDFDPDYGMESTKFIVNEEAVRAMGDDDPIGKQISLWGEMGEIVGVVKDFHMASLYAEIKPTVIQHRTARWLFLRTEAGRTPEAIAGLKEVYDQFGAAYPLEYQFLDDSFRQAYHGELVIGKLAGYFSGFALFIASLGLFGLVSFVAQQRTREMGIRKVLGATISNLSLLLSKDFMKLVLIAFMITAPLAYFVMNYWLENNFAYRTELGPGVFMITGGLALLIALATVSYQAIRTALMNPVKSLRYE
ncbi:MAG: ABC transporter permease [Bacteroidota bacterium]